MPHPTPDELKKMIPNFLRGIFGEEIQVFELDLGELSERLRNSKLEALRTWIEKPACDKPGCVGCATKQEWLELEAMLPEEVRPRMRVLFEKYMMQEIDHATQDDKRMDNLFAAMRASEPVY